MNVSDVTIWDAKEKRYVTVNKFIRNIQSSWVKVEFSNGATISVTTDHPFEICGKGVVLAGDLKKGDMVLYEYSPNFDLIKISIERLYPYTEENFSYDVETESEHFTVNKIYSHNCRSFLTPYVDENGKPKYYGRLTKPSWADVKPL